MLSVFFLLPLVLILVGPAFSEGLRPFVTDGCSHFPDGTVIDNDLWLSCCIAHDRAYWAGGTYRERREADRKLFECVTLTGQPLIAELMLQGVRIGGSPFWPTGFRWGYGWPYLRGYKKLTTEELEEVKKCNVDLHKAMKGKEARGRLNEEKNNNSPTIVAK